MASILQSFFLIPCGLSMTIHVIFGQTNLTVANVTITAVNATLTLHPDNSTNSTGSPISVTAIVTSVPSAATNPPGTATASPPVSSANCPGGWIRHRNSCYLAATGFYGVTFYAALAFCEALSGGKGGLIEINDMDEYAFINETAKNVSWPEGPWIGMVRMTDATHFQLLAEQRESDDASLNAALERLAWQNRDAAADGYIAPAGVWAYDAYGYGYGYGLGGGCGGMNRYGNSLGFWSCTTGGTPWCEIHLA